MPGKAQAETGGPRDPLVGPAIALAAGVWLSAAYQVDAAQAAMLTVVFTALACVPGGARLRLLCACLAAASAGAVSESFHRAKGTPQLNIERNETALLSGCVVEPLSRDDERAWFTLELAPGARMRVTAWVQPEDPYPELRYGQQVEVAGKVREPRNFGNPGAFDFAGYLARRDTYWLATVRKGDTPAVLEGNCGSAWRAAIFRIRTAALKRLRAMFAGDPPAAALLAATLIGDSSQVEDAWTEAFRRTGTYHTLVISGLHITTLAAVLFWPLRLGLAGELKAMFAAGVLAWVYALVSGATPPVIRAAAAFTLFLCARFVFRRTRVLNILGAIAIVVLLLDPGQLWEASFQLSFLSVAAVGGLAGPALDHWVKPRQLAARRLALKEMDPKLPIRWAAQRVEWRLLAETIALVMRLSVKTATGCVEYALRAWYGFVSLAVGSLVMQVVLALPMALFFHRVSLTGITANIVLVPWMSALVPVGFAALFTGWAWLGTLSAHMLAIAITVAQWHAEREPAWRISDPPGVLVALLAAALIGCILLQGRWRALSAACILPGTLLLVAQPFEPALQGSLELTSIDVGQGESLLVVTPEGKTLLVDGGGLLPTRAGKRPRLDIGEDVVSSYLWNRGLRRLDAVALTHAHADHAGGLHAVLDNFRPAVLWTGAHPDPELSKRAAATGVRQQELRAPQSFDFGGARLEVLAPFVDHANAEAGNNDSLVLRISYGRNVFLLTGDIERAVEEGLLAEPERLRADVLKVAHHGSRTSTSQEFLNAVRPSFATVSAGLDNRFRHPSPEVVGRLASVPAAVLRTDQLGLITLRSDGTRISLQCNRWSANAARRAPVFSRD